MAGKPNRSGLRNGTKLTRLSLGELPRTMLRQTRVVRKYRRGLEDAVVEAHGEINFTRAHLIDEAATAELHAAVCRWLLRTRLEKMTVSDIARCSEQILKARTIRNRAVERLKIDRDAAENVLEALYTRVPIDDSPSELEDK